MKKYAFYLTALLMLSLIIISCSDKLVILNRKQPVSEAVAETSGNAKLIYAREQEAQLSFGQAFAISGDYLIVGSPTTNSKQGLAYIFRRDGDNWNEVTKLEKSNKSKDDYFGYSVSVHGNYALVGVPGHNAEDGQAYICKNDGADNWQEIAMLTAQASKKTNKSFFGCSVALYGDYAMVGANAVGKDLGAVYVFKNTGNDSWKQIGILSASDETSIDNFGFSLALYENYLIIGAPSAGSGGKNRGQAYIYKNDGAGNWKEVAILKASDQDDDNYFGRKVSLYGNYAAVGAPAADSGHWERGQVYIFKNDGTDNWKETAILKASDQLDNDHFGNSVSIFGSHVVVGAPGCYNGNGQAYIFKNMGADKWQETDILKPGAKPLYHHFGMDVSIYGNAAVCSALTANSYNDDKRGGLYIFPKERATQGPRISFDRLDYELGRIGQNGKYDFSFKFTNTGSAALNILDVQSSCVCTVLDKQEKNTLAPGESSEIRGTFNSETLKGTVMRGIYVKSNDPEQPEVYLNLSAIIEAPQP